jgi:uncharacterized protein
MPNVAVLGASRDRSKYGNRAVRAYLRQGYTVYPVHPSAPSIEGQPAYRSVLEIPAAELDRITIYLPPSVSAAILGEVARKPAREVWFNPGADGPEVVRKARELGLNVITGCSIMAIGVSPYKLD